MKCQTVLVYVLSFSAAALAQSIAIGSPTPEQVLPPGQAVIVIVERPNSLTPSTEVGIAITLHHCTQTPCEDTTQQLGSGLYHGAFEPTLSPNGGPPNQNFTVTVPDGFQHGPAILNVVHSTLVGAGPNFFNEIKNVQVNVV